MVGSLVFGGWCFFTCLAEYQPAKKQISTLVDLKEIKVLSII